MVQSVRFRSPARPIKKPRRSRSRLDISGTMSADAVVRHYPKTETLFKALQIKRFHEGSESVEELTSRHGIETEQFLDKLEKLAAVFPGSRLIREQPAPSVKQY